MAGIISKRVLHFVGPEDNEFYTLGKNTPQEVPEWLLKTDYFAIAEAAGDVTILGQAPSQPVDPPPSADPSELDAPTESSETDPDPSSDPDVAPSEDQAPDEPVTPQTGNKAGKKDK